MSHFFLDVTRLLSRLSNGLRPTGVDRVGLAYVRRYGANASAVLSERGFSSVLTEEYSQKIFDTLLSLSSDKFTIRKLVTRALANQLFERVRSNGILLHTSHNGMEYLRYYQAMARKNIRPVFMVHDVIPLTHSEYCRPGVSDIHRTRIYTALQHASGLIANSQATLDSLISEANFARFSVPPTVVAPLASGVDIHPSRPRPIEEPYFVMLGTIEPRKNHWLILHVWRRLVELYGKSAPKLVIIGRRGWECENVVDMLDRCSALRDCVIEEADCSDIQLHNWLQHAQALLFPSFVEGFGMPLVEALALQVPVLASELGVFHEIAGDIPDYIDPLDGTEWLRHIEAFSKTDSAERNAQLKRIENFREPTWDEHFDQVDGLLDSLRR